MRVRSDTSLGGTRRVYQATAQMPQAELRMQTLQEAFGDAESLTRGGRTNRSGLRGPRRRRGNS